MTAVSKRATDSTAFLRASEWYPSARSAFRVLLQRMGVPERGKVLLPAYIGWSPREGSGVFDPIAELRAPHAFYRLTPRLHIDLDDFRARLHGVRVAVLIHYFGYPDPCFREAAALAHEVGSLVLEDEAHAMLSDLVGGACGREGDASIFSLHKMLPVDVGGCLVANDARWCRMCPTGGVPIRPGPWDYDLAAIAQARRANARQLLTALAPFEEVLTVLQPDLPDGVVPQTLPVLLIHADRNRVYARMNDQGFGVVSLYHTLVSAVDATAYPDSHAVARRILNLPVHQDASPEALTRLVAALGRVLREEEC